jgi:hypothetical protein
MHEIARQLYCRAAMTVEIVRSLSRRHRDDAANAA